MLGTGKEHNQEPLKVHVLRFEVQGLGFRVLHAARYGDNPQPLTY